MQNDHSTPTIETLKGEIKYNSKHVSVGRIRKWCCTRYEQSKGIQSGALAVRCFSYARKRAGRVFYMHKNESLENHWLINYLNMHGIVLYMPLTLIIILNHTFCYAGYLKSAFLFKSLYQDVLKHYFYKALSCQPAVPS